MHLSLIVLKLPNPHSMHMCKLQNKAKGQMKQKEVHRHGEEAGRPRDRRAGGWGAWGRGEGLRAGRRLQTPSGIRTKHRNYNRRYCNTCGRCQVGAGRTGGTTRGVTHASTHDAVPLGLT